MNKLYFYKIASWAGILAPSLAFAQGEILDLLIKFGEILDLIIPITVALALLFFFWGLARFIWSAGNQVDKEKGRDLMIWGIVALFVMVSVWGLVRLLKSSFNINETNSIDVNELLIQP